MANHKLLFGHVIKWEGGHGADLNDTALKNCGHSGMVGYDKKWPKLPVHTSHGVTWCTWNEYHRMKGLKATGERFIQMPKDVWEDIFKTLFWDKIFGDYLNSQAIAENFFDAIWGSGPGGAAKNIRAVQRFLISKGYKIKDDGAMGMNTVKALNAYANTKTKELEVVNVQLKERKEFYDALAKQGYQWAKFYNGWMNRLNDLYARSTQLINSSGGKIIGGVLLAGIAGYIAYRLAGSPAIKIFS